MRGRLGALRGAPAASASDERSPGRCLGLVFYATDAQLIWIFLPTLPLPMSPVSALEPFRIADRYGLFAVMTHERYEIEFQGSNDGKTWMPYPFRYKPQDVKKAPGIYAPYQPRFDWNLWFASLGSWQDYRFVLWTEERLLQNDRDVLQLFAGNPFASGSQPIACSRGHLSILVHGQKTKRETGDWWQRELLGAYAPALERQPDGKIGIVDSQSRDSRSNNRSHPEPRCAASVSTSATLAKGHR